MVNTYEFVAEPTPFSIFVIQKFVKLMKKNWAYRLLEFQGWTIPNEVELPAKSVLCVAPHTSNWDFIYGMLFKKAVHLDAHFFMKKEWFRFPLGGLMRSLGGVPVDRSKKTALTDQIAEEFSKHDVFHIAITPEGTRKAVPDWKKGFYIIAQKAGVPIVLTYIDFAKKEIGYGKIVQPTGNMEGDMAEIKAFFRTKVGKIPENFGI